MNTPPSTVAGLEPELLPFNHTRNPDAEIVGFTSTEQVLGPDGVLYKLEITGEAELVRGPLGRFIDLADQIVSEGLTVPSEIRDVLDKLTEQN